MLTQASALMANNPLVEGQEANAQTLPFADGRFDAGACQFGAMFFPDKVGAYREARRV
jgi:ubiquinone/menaquinone biosynthesis C-methylase UbiE